MSRVVSDLIRSRMQAARDESEAILRAALTRSLHKHEQQPDNSIRDQDTTKQVTEGGGGSS